MKDLLFPVAVIAILTLLLTQGCAKDEGPFYVQPPLDTINGFDTVSFADVVLPIFIQHCWVCHPPNGGMDLGLHNAYAELVNVTSTGYPPEKRVVPYDPMASVLWHKVISSGEFGLAMPPNGVITTEELLSIRSWIEQGAMDN
ncbi:MAG: hypothetical protein K9J06_04630 [Flavobacteriales bacterium]|nr:hypothetical protein [Flavobacteriales bacterium]